MVRSVRSAALCAELLGADGGLDLAHVFGEGGFVDLAVLHAHVAVPHVDFALAQHEVIDGSERGAEARPQGD